MKYYQDNSVTLYNGDCRSMYELEEGSIQMVCCSPPYWGLRKYAGLPDLVWDDWKGQLGLEPTPDCGRPFMGLRKDLTQKEREYVIQRLKEEGLL